MNKIFDEIKDYILHKYNKLYITDFKEYKWILDLSNFPINKEYIYFLENIGSCFIGQDIIGYENDASMGKTNIVDINTMENYKNLPIGKDYFIISIDGSGNPIYMCEDNKIYMFVHDSWGELEIAKDFRTWIEELWIKHKKNLTNGSS